MYHSVPPLCHLLKERGCYQNSCCALHICILILIKPHLWLHSNSSFEFHIHINGEEPAHRNSWWLQLTMNKMFCMHPKRHSVPPMYDSRQRHFITKCTSVKGKKKPFIFASSSKQKGRDALEVGQGQYCHLERICCVSSMKHTSSPQNNL